MAQILNLRFVDAHQKSIRKTKNTSSDNVMCWYTYKMIKNSFLMEVNTFDTIDQIKKQVEQGIKVRKAMFKFNHLTL